jgi:hypothetical protein
MERQSEERDEVHERVSSRSADELKRIVARAIREAVANHQEEVRETLQLCAVAFEEAASLDDAPRHFRILARVCHALCLDGLGVDGEDPGESLDRVFPPLSR